MAQEKNVTTKDSKAAKKPEKARRFHPIRYLKEMWGEVKKLAWLSWKDLIKHTVAVIVFVLAMSVVIYLLDMGFSAGVQGLSSIGGNTAVSDPAAPELTETTGTEDAADDAASSEDAGSDPQE